MARFTSQDRRILAETLSYVDEAPAAMSVRLVGTSCQAAVTVAHGLTMHLDKNNGLYRPSPVFDEHRFRLVDCLAEAQCRTTDMDDYVFGEKRPAERNMAVRVENHSFTMIADVRNELEDRPELGGAELLRLGFIAAVQSLDY